MRKNAFEPIVFDGDEGLFPQNQQAACLPGSAASTGTHLEAELKEIDKLVAKLLNK